MSVSRRSETMILKAVIFIVILQIVAIWCYPQKFMIKNKKTGLVLDGSQQYIDLTPWANKNTQLWTLESSATHGHYIVRNIGNLKVLDACPRTKALLVWNLHNGTNQRWNLNPNQDTRLQVQFYPHYFLADKNRALLQWSTQTDDSDIWLLVDPQTL